MQEKKACICYTKIISQKPIIKFISQNDNVGIKIKNPRPEFTNHPQWSRKAMDTPERKAF